MNRAGYVFQPRAHLQRVDEFARQLRYMLAHGVDAQDHVVVSPCGTAHKPTISTGFHAQRPAVGGQREVTDLGLIARGLGLIR